MAAEAQQRDSAEHEEAGQRRKKHTCSLARSAGSEHEERQRKPGRQLHADADHQRSGGCAKARTRAGRQQQRGAEHQHDQRVVVRAADCEHEQHWVQADERARPATRVPEPACGACDQRDRAEAAEDGERFERPQRAADAERHRCVAEQREQRPVGRVLVGPAEEREDFVGRGLRGHVRVGIEPVQRAHPREADVAEHVLGDQRRAEQQDRVRSGDREDDRGERKSARKQQHQHVARAHDQRQCLEAARAESEVQTGERPGQPRRPAAAARRHVLRWFAGGAGARQKDGDDHAKQAEHPQ